MTFECFVEVFCRGSAVDLVLVQRGMLLVAAQRVRLEVQCMHFADSNVRYHG